MIFKNHKFTVRYNHHFYMLGRQLACTIFLHVLLAGVAEHLWCRWGCSHPITVDHHLHVLVHWIGPVQILETGIYFVFITSQTDNLGRE